ncbi:MAG: PAS domain-containing protein [Lachnospiraceae bacterium]|nr:PAS domain-containing protein [Lachnospiraceae bacterium]
MERNRIFSSDLSEIIPTEERMPAIEWLSEQMPGGFFIYRADESTELLYVNQSTCEIFGCKDVHEFRELTGNTFRGMVHPDDYDSIQDSIDNQIASASNVNNMDYVAYRIIRKDGAIRWIDDYGHFANLPGYGDVYYVFIEDITESKLADEEKERNRTLSLALEEAEQANVTKIAFLSNMSHEIRTPMNAIIGLYNIALKKEGIDEETRDILSKIGESAKHLLSLINDILDISRIESGHARLKNEEFAFGNMIEQINTMTESQCGDKGLVFDCTVRGHMDDRYIGDDMKLRQLIINILGNAVKYTPSPGKVTFSVEEKNAGTERP